MIQKAGKLSFLLVCLFLCTACGREKAVFQAGVRPVENVETKISAEEQKPEETVPVNINTAEAGELMTLPGIGKVRAEAIIAYRQSAGKFEKIEDIMNVKGIKTGIFSKISSLICVE